MREAYWYRWQDVLCDTSSDMEFSLHRVLASRTPSPCQGSPNHCRWHNHKFYPIAFVFPFHLPSAPRAPSPLALSALVAFVMANKAADQIANNSSTSQSSNMQILTLKLTVLLMMGSKFIDNMNSNSGNIEAKREKEIYTLLLKKILFVGRSLVDCIHELHGKWTGPEGNPSTTMVSKKNSLWCRLITVMAPGDPNAGSIMNSAVYTTLSAFKFFFSYQSLITASPLFFGFLVTRRQ